MFDLFGTDVEVAAGRETRTHPGRSPRADKGSGGVGVQAGAEFIFRRVLVVGDRSRGIERVRLYRAD